MWKCAVPKPFEPTRPDGRSDRQVIYELAADAAPGTVFKYDELVDELAADLDVEVDRRRVYRAVTNANGTLLREKQRYLRVVKDVGYRVLHAEEHLPAAIDRKQSAVAKLKQGMELLRHAKMDELTEAQRVLHQGQLMIISGLYDAVKESHRRQNRQDQVIKEIRERQRADIEELRKRLEAVERQQDR
jgi:hypothetical protein